MRGEFIMATPKNSTTKVRFSAKTFAAGIAKSTSAAIISTLSSYAPYTTDTISNLASSAADTAKFVKENNPFKRSKNKDPMMRRIMNDANDVFDNLHDDFITGDMSFSGTKEVLDSFTDKYGDDEWETDDDDPFADDGDSSYNSFNAKTYADGIYTTATAITQSSRISANAIIGHNYKAMKAMSNKMIAANMANFAKINTVISMTNGKLDAVNNNIISLVEFNNTTVNDYIKNMSEHIARQQSFMDNVNKLLTDIHDGMTGKQKASDFDTDKEYNFLRGGFDFNKFMKNFYDNSMVGNEAAGIIASVSKLIFGKVPKSLKSDMASSITDSIKNINPMRMLLEAFVPQIKRVEDFDKQIKNGMEIFFARAFEGKLFEGNSLLNSIMKQIGYKKEPVLSGMYSYEKGSVPWNGKDSITLQVVIPEYLSSIEQNLKDIQYNIVSAIRSVTDTITLYGEMYRTGDKNLQTDTYTDDGKYRTKYIRKADGSLHATTIRDESVDFEKGSKYNRNYFDYESGTFTNSKDLEKKTIQKFANAMQNSYDDAMSELEKYFKDNPLSDSDRTKVRDMFIDLMTNFSFDGASTLDDDEVQEIASTMQSINPGISRDDVSRIVAAINKGRLKSNEEYEKYTKDAASDPTMHLISNKAFFGDANAREYMKQMMRDKNMVTISSFSSRLRDWSTDGKSAAEIAEMQRRRREEEKMNERTDMFSKFSRGLRELLFEDGDITNNVINNGLGSIYDGISGALNRASNVINGVPEFATGALNIDRDKIVKVHKGEIILPPETSEAVRDNIEKFIRGEISDIDEELTGKATAETLRNILRNKNHKKVTNVTVATEEMWESEDIKHSSNLSEWFTYKIDEIGENLKIIGKNSIERVKEEAKKIDNNNANGINHKLTGEKNENGYYEDGLLSKFANRFVSAKNKAMHALRGTAYTDYDTYETVEEDKKNSFIGKYKEFLKEQVGSLANSFGMSEENKKSVTDTVEFLAENTDKAIIGGAGSLIASALLGVSINPLLGAGAALALSHDKIKDKLFGTKDETGNRKDNGLISPEKQKFIKDNIFKLVTGGIAGIAGMNLAKNSMLGSSVATMVSGLTSGLASSGTVGGIVGGVINTTASLAMSPLAGALIGVGGMAMLQSESVKKVLFGEEVEIDGKKVRQGGIFGGLKKSLHKVTDAIATSIMGDKYKQTDEDGNEITVRRGGILGALKNAINVHVIEPIKDTGSYIKDYFKLWFEFDVIGNIGHIVDPIRVRMENFADALMDGVKGATNQMTETIKKVLSPLTGAVKEVGDALFQMTLGSVKGAAKMALGIASTPLKMLAAIMNIGNSRQRFNEKIRGIGADLGIFKEEFKEFNEKLAVIWFGEGHKERREKFLEGLATLVDVDRSPIFNGIAKPIAEGITTAVNGIVSNFKESDTYKRMTEFFNKVGGFFGKVGSGLGKAGKWVGTNVLGGMGQRILHPLTTAKNDFDTGYNAVEGIKQKVGDKFKSSKLGSKLEQTSNLFGSSFKDSKMILRDKLGIGLGSIDSKDKEASQERVRKYLDDKYGLIDTQSIKDELDLLTRSGINTDRDKERYKMLRNELKSYDILQNRINKEKRRLSKTYGYKDEDFNNLSTTDQEKIRKRIAKVSGLDTSEWTTEDIAKFAHGTKGDKKKEEESKKVQEATLKVPEVIEQAQLAIIDNAEERHEVILETVDNVEAAIREGFMGSNETYMDTQKGMAQGIHNCFVRYVESNFNRLIYAITGEKPKSTLVDQGVFDSENYSSNSNSFLAPVVYTSRENTLVNAISTVVDTQNKIADKQEEGRSKRDEHRENVAKDKEKRSQDQAKIKESQARGSDNSVDNDTNADNGIFNSENYVEDGTKKEGLLSKIASLPMKMLGGAASLIKGIGSFISGNTVALAVGLGATMAWPLLKKIPWGKVINGAINIVGKAASMLVSGAAHLVTEVVPTVVAEVVKNVPDMVTTLTTGIVDGIQIYLDDREQKKTEANTYVNSEGDAVDSDLTKVDASDIAGKAIQASTLGKVTKSATNSALNATIGEKATKTLGQRISKIGSKIKEFLSAFFKKNLNKSVSKKVAKSKTITKIAKANGITGAQALKYKAGVAEYMTSSINNGIDNILKKLDDAIKYITKDNILVRKASDLLNKLAGKFGFESFGKLTAQCAGYVAILSVGYNMATGAAAAERYFHLRHATWPDPGDTDALMRTIAATLKTAENMTGWFGILVSIFFDMLADLSTTNPGLANAIGYDGDIRCTICTGLYNLYTISEDRVNKLRLDQIKFEDETNAYNEKFGTKINTTQMARGQNMSLFEKGWDLVTNTDSSISTDWRNQDAPDIAAVGTSTENHTSGGFGYGDNSASVGRGERFGDSIGYGHFVQNDPRWSRRGYGRFRSGRKSTIGSGGCGPTALANAINNVNGGLVTNPASVASFASKHGYSVDGGTSAGLFNSGASKLGVTSREINRNGSSIKSQLKNGNNIIISGKGGSAFTPAGHIMTVKGVDGRGNAVVDDPLRHSSRHIPFRALTKGMTHAWSIGRGKRKAIGYGKVFDSGDNYAVANEIFDNGQIPVYDSATDSFVAKSADILKNEGMFINPEKYNGIIYGYSSNTDAGCYLNSLISAIISKLIGRKRSISGTGLKYQDISGSYLEEAINEFSPSKVKALGYAEDNGYVNTSSPTFIREVSARIIEKLKEFSGKRLNKQGDDILNLLGSKSVSLDDVKSMSTIDYRGYDSQVIIDAVASALANASPVILHTKSDIDSDSTEPSWAEWRKAVFGNRSQHAVLLMGADTSIDNKSGYAMIGDPGSSQVSVNGFNTDLSKGGQIRLVPLDMLMSGLREFGPKLNHILPIADVDSKGSMASQLATSAASNDLYKNIIGVSNKEYTRDTNSTTSATNSTSSDTNSSGSDTSSSTFFDYISAIGERLSRVGAAALDWLFTGKFEDPFANEKRVSSSGGSVYDIDMSGEYKNTAIEDMRHLLKINSRDIKGMKPSKSAEEIVQIAYAYAVENGLPFNISADSDALMASLLAAEIMAANSTYLQKYKLVSDGTIKTSLTSEGFVYEVIVRVLKNVGPSVIQTFLHSKNGVKDVVKNYTKTANIDHVIKIVLARHKQQKQDVTTANLTYDGLDLAGYQSFATQSAGYSNIVGGYVSSRMSQGEQRDILGYIRRMTSWDETGQDPMNYSNINDLYFNPVHLAWNNEHSITLGRHGFYADNAAEIMARLANAPISPSDKQKAINYAAAIKNHTVNDSFKNELATFIQKPEISPYVKHIQDAMSVQFSDFYLSRILPNYDSGIIKDPRSVILGAEFAGVAPYKTGVYYEQLGVGTPAPNELETVASSMKKHYGLKGWQARIDGVLGALTTGNNSHLGASFTLPKSVYDDIPEGASEYTGSVAGYGLAETMSNSMRNVPSGSGYGSDDVYMGDADHPVNVTMDSSPITRRLDAILSWLEELTKEYPEKAGPISGYGSGPSESKTNPKLVATRNKLLGDNDHVINGTAQDKLRIIHNSVAGRTRV